MRQEPTYTVQHCNALNTAVPKLLRKMYRANPDGHIWAEGYYVYTIARDQLLADRREIARDCKPWFDASAFEQPDDRLYVAVGIEQTLAGASPLPDNMESCGHCIGGFDRDGEEDAQGLHPICHWCNGQGFLAKGTELGLDIHGTVYRSEPRA